ncbi:MAG: hypothetical protein LBR97_02190, partial [Dysgonamonadaceae bacterium]|nr:hypothetical protein [Dysgonamonadaceae bacterium]
MKNQFLSSIVACLVLTSVYAQQFEFSHIDNTNGLSNNQAESIFKDSRGFLWIGT